MKAKVAFFLILTLTFFSLGFYCCMEEFEDSFIETRFNLSECSGLVKINKSDGLLFGNKIPKKFNEIIFIIRENEKICCDIEDILKGNGRSFYENKRKHYYLLRTVLEKGIFVDEIKTEIEEWEFKLKQERAVLIEKLKYFDGYRNKN